MSNSKLNKISKQQDLTWSKLHRRLIEIPFDFSEIFSPSVAKFLNTHATSTSSNIGYFTATVLATTAFIVSLKSKVDMGTHTTTLNCYTVFVGPPMSGKSVAIANAAQDPLQAIVDDNPLGDIIINKPTSSAMQRILSELKMGVLLSGEIYDPLNKLLKSDEDNASGDAQLLCELFSGEQTAYCFPTEKSRKIEKNTPFSIIGCTKLPYAARLIPRLDQGHRLLDGMIFITPNCLRPSPYETKTAIEERENSIT